MNHECQVKENPKELSIKQDKKVLTEKFSWQSKNSIKQFFPEYFPRASRVVKS